MDEPTIGLDAVAGKQVRKFLKEVNEERGTTILLTSHYMEDIKSLCSRCMVVNHGSKIYDGSTEQLFDRYQKNKKITLSFDNPTQFTHKENGWRVLEDAPYKKVFEVPKEKSGECLGTLLELAPGGCDDRGGRNRKGGGFTGKEGTPSAHQGIAFCFANKEGFQCVNTRKQP